MNTDLQYYMVGYVRNGDTMKNNDNCKPEQGFPDIPVELDGLAGYSGRCTCGRVHSIDTQQFVLRPGAVGDLLQCVQRFSRGKRMGVLADAITDALAGRDVSDFLRTGGFEVTRYVVPDAEGGRPHATFDSVLDVEQHLQHVEFIVAVGSGTINDLGKLVSYRLGIPYLVVATAPSMNGYTSAIAAIMKDGLKITVDCHQPVAVVADLDILVGAPLYLIQAGLGDLESKPVSTADFKLSSLLRGSWYCPAPGAVVAEAEARAAACADGLATRDVDAIRVLTEALLLSGCSMKLAGSSSPASGGEHLISHYWDMTAAAEGRVEGFHGAQVGVATLVSAALYEFLGALSPETIDIDRLVSTKLSAARELDIVAARHGVFGKLAAAEFAAKRFDDDDYRRELEFIVANWKYIWESLGMLKPAARIREVLQKAGCPITVRALGLTDDHLRRGFLYAREIRGRFTVLDFAAELGVLEMAASSVFSRSGCLEI
jgi:glycerol-1-phosphate dehydrogenase [NAD(P)+]